MELPPKYCPRCGEEYVHAATRCADCGVELALEPPQPGAPEEPLGTPVELAPVRSADLRWIQALEARLAGEGIASHVELVPAEPGRGPASRGTLFVRPEDAPRAAEVDTALAREQIPDLPEHAAAGWVESDRCPACEAAIPPEAEECPGCGLVFAPAEGR